MPRTLFPATAAFLLMALPAGAQVLSNTDATIRNGLCIGNSCADDPALSGNELYLSSTRNQLFFEDTTASGGGVTDWEFEFNSGTDDNFVISDLTNGTAMLQITAGAPDNALFMGANGNIGLGTSLPQVDLHVVSSIFPGIRLEQTGSGGLGPQTWEITGSDTAFSISDINTGTSPFAIEDEALNFSLAISESGNVGIGTAFGADASLHVRRVDNTARVLVEDIGASGAQEMFKLSNNGGSFFTFENTAANTTWFFVHEDAAPNRFIITDDVPDGPEFTLTAEGDLTIPGNFISGSTTLNVPDYVFEADYALRPLAEVEAFIDTNKHLPDVPSAAEIAGTGLDMTQMQMTLLKKVEELTLYTIALEENAKAQKQINADLIARLEMLE